MARARNIKPGFFDNELLGELPALTRLLFIGLWCLADREGRLQDRPKRIKKELLGYDDVTADDVDTMLQQLHDNEFIQRYEIAGERYIQVINFSKHQNPHCKEQTSVIPAPGEDTGLGVVTTIHVKGRTETAGNSQDPRTYQTEKEQASVILAPGEDMGLGVVADHIKGRTETAENSQDPRTYQTEKEQENTRTQDMHSASTVQTQEKHRSCPADSLIPDSLIPESKTYTVGCWATTGAPEQEDIDDGQETKSGKRQQQSPDWKTARTPLEIGFCKFWDVYPNVRKRAKPACWRKWKTIKPDEPMVEHILHAIEVCKQSGDWKRGYVPMPLTWLTQGRWEDISEEVSVNEHSSNGSNAAGNHTAGFRTTADY